jgi:hypothetical protein
MLGVDLEIRQYEDPPRPAWFGYPTVPKFLRIENDVISPQRYVDRTGATIMVDGAAIFSGPLQALYQESNPPYGVDKVILVAALQRLSNGMAMRLLRDRVFREKVAPQFNPLRREFGVFVFRTTAVNDDYGTRIRVDPVYPKTSLVK